MPAPIDPSSTFEAANSMVNTVMMVLGAAGVFLLLLTVMFARLRNSSDVTDDEMTPLDAIQTPSTEGSSLLGFNRETLRGAIIALFLIGGIIVAAVAFAMVFFA